MTFEEFVEWVQSLVEERRLTDLQGGDVIEQRHLFDVRRDELEEAYDGKAVGYVGGELLVADRVSSLLDGAHDSFEGRMLYFEPINYRIF